jgi:uncharacterized membrane protein (UPF0127 family)
VAPASRRAFVQGCDNEAALRADNIRWAGLNSDYSFKGLCMAIVAITCRQMLFAVGIVLLSALSSGAQPQQTAEIITKNGIRVITVEVVRSDEQLVKGLSGRKELPAGSGMLFDFPGEMNAKMNTKDMLFPLDMIFIRSDGFISSIIENTEPGSLRQNYSKGVVRGVLEVPGGSAKMLGITVGDRVMHPIFRTAR